MNNFLSCSLALVFLFSCGQQSEKPQGNTIKDYVKSIGGGIVEGVELNQRENSTELQVTINKWVCPVGKFSEKDDCAKSIALMLISKVVGKFGLKQATLTLSFKSGHGTVTTHGRAEYLGEELRYIPLS